MYHNLAGPVSTWCTKIRAEGRQRADGETMLMVKTPPGQVGLSMV